MNINTVEGISIRKAEAADIPAITEIYNEAVLNGVATFDTEPKTIENRLEWFSQHGPNHPILVAIDDNRVLAWASLSRWSDRSAYDGTAEVSVYVHKDHRGKGIGSVIFKSLLDEAENLDLHYLLSRITQGNETSIRLHLRNGFSMVGVMHEVGKKFGEYLDVTILEKLLSDKS